MVWSKHQNCMLCFIWDISHTYIFIYIFSFTQHILLLLIHLWSCYGKEGMRCECMYFLECNANARMQCKCAISSNANACISILGECAHWHSLDETACHPVPQCKLCNQSWGTTEMGDHWELCTQGYAGGPMRWGTNENCITRVTLEDQWEQGRKG